MSGIWRGVMYAGVLAAAQPPMLMAAPLLTAAAEAAQPAAQPAAAPTAPVPPAPPAAPRMRYSDQSEREREAQAQAREREREAQERAREAARDAQAREREANRAQGRNDKERGTWVDTDPIVREFKGGDGMTLDLLNMFGDVVVVGGKGKDGKLSIVRRIQGRTPDADALLKAYEIDVTEHANRIAVRTTMPKTMQQRSNRPRIRTDYQIALPAGTALELKNMAGNVRLSNVAGDVRVEAMAGDVVGEALSRVRMLRSMSGDVLLSRSVIEGDANLQSVSGNVIASGVKATSLTMGSVSGNVQIKESSSARALVRTVSGDIEFAAMPRKAGRYEIKTHAGNIFVFAPSTSGFEFEANTFKGDVQTDVQTDAPTQPTGPGPRQVRGSVGDGSAFFDLTSFTGDIKVIKKQQR